MGLLKALLIQRGTPEKAEVGWLLSYFLEFYLWVLLIVDAKVLQIQYRGIENSRANTIKFRP